MATSGDHYPATSGDFSMATDTGFEPATSGRRRRRRNYCGLKPEAADSLGVVRDSPSLPVSGYPSNTEWYRPNVDRFRTQLESLLLDSAAVAACLAAIVVVVEEDLGRGAAQVAAPSVDALADRTSGDEQCRGRVGPPPAQDAVRHEPQQQCGRHVRAQ